MVILHGLYGSGDNWLGIAKSLSGICEVFLVDQRNHGKSPHSDEHSYQSLSNDLLEIFDDNDLDKAVVLGHSMGGKAAMWFAAQHSSRILRLIVADISPRSYNDNLSESSHITFHTKIIRAMLSVDFSTAKGLRDIDHQLEDQLPDKYLRQFLLKNIEKDSDSSFYWRLNLRALLQNLGNLSSGLESFLDQGKIFTRFPVQFLRGDHSGYIKEDDIIMIRKMYPNAQITSIKNAGHWLHAEQPEAVISLIKRGLIE